MIAHAVDAYSFPELAAATNAKPWTLRRRYGAAIDGLVDENDVVRVARTHPLTRWRL
ncbi:MAG: hypothetical protein R3A52_10615 [Polyangiales bacterium]